MVDMGSTSRLILFSLENPGLLVKTSFFGKGSTSYPRQVCVRGRYLPHFLCRYLALDVGLLSISWGQSSFIFVTLVVVAGSFEKSRVSIF